MDLHKICVIGGAGSGKTVLTNNLGRVLSLPVYHLDGINYEPNWVEVDKTIKNQKILDIVSTDKWIIDGTYNGTLSNRAKKADLVIFLDYSALARTKGLLTRYFRLRNKEREEIPGCKEQFKLEFLTSPFRWKKRKYVKIMESLNEINDDKLLIFKNRRQLNKWFKETFNDEIKL